MGQSKKHVKELLLLKKETYREVWKLTIYYQHDLEGFFNNCALILTAYLIS